MKEILLILCLPGLALAGLSEPQPLASPAPDPTCGFISGPHEYREAADVKQGLAVDLVVGQPRIDQPITLRFFVNERPRSEPVEMLQVEHEKLMHVIGVRDDLREFFHLHPLKVGPGMWEVTHTFAHGGGYKIWTDVKYRGVSYSFGQPLLVVTGALGESLSRASAGQCRTPQGYLVSLTSSAPVTLERTNQFAFVIQDTTGAPVETEDYLGAPMHLVIVKDDQSVYIHAHPEGRRVPTIGFRQAFPKPGTYKLFAQFRPRGAKLNADESILAEFQLELPLAKAN